MCIRDSGDKAGDVKDASLKASPSLKGVVIDIWTHVIVVYDLLNFVITFLYQCFFFFRNNNTVSYTHLPERLDSIPST